MAFESSGIELFNNNDRQPPESPNGQPVWIEDPFSLKRGQRVRVSWMASRLTVLAVTTMSTGKNGQNFSFTRHEHKLKEALHSEVGVISKAMPDALPETLDAQTVHFTPDPVFRTTPDGEIQKQSQPPLVIHEDNFPKYDVTAA
jgi:hypothetical protein